MFSGELLDKISRYIGENRQEALDFWRDLVNYEGKHGEKDKLLLTAGFLREKFESI